MRSNSTHIKYCINSEIVNQFNSNWKIRSNGKIEKNAYSIRVRSSWSKTVHWSTHSFEEGRQP